jgi:multiple sugar transport system permease protein
MSVRQRLRDRTFLALAYTAFALFVLFPLAWILLMSLKDFADVIAYPPKFLFTPTLDNYRAVLFPGTTPRGLTTGVADYLRFLRNSGIVSSAAVLLSCLVGIPAAYALARLSFRGRESIAFTFLSFRFAPELAVILPLYAIYQNLRLYDSFVGMILAHQLITLPLVVWIMRGFFQDVPIELEEAGKVDGASSWQILLRIAVPVVRPGIASAAIIAFIFSWNNLILGLVLAGQNTQPVTVGILQTMNFDQIQWGWMAAAAIIAAVPGMVFAIYLQRHLVRGLTLGTAK